MSESQAAQLAQLETYLHHQRTVVDYALLCAASIILWDFLLNFAREYKLVWKKDWNYQKFLFIVVRYVPIISLPFQFKNQLVPGTTRESCLWSFPTQVWLIFWSILIAEGVLIVRTWAVWKRDLRIGVFFALLWSGIVGAAVYGNVIFIRSVVISPPPFPGFRGCFVTLAGDQLNKDFVLLLVMEIILLGFMGFSAYRTMKTNSNFELSKIIHRDGVLFYVYLVITTTANVIVMYSSAPDLHSSFIPLTNALYSVLTSRVALNIRDYADRDVINGEIDTLGLSYQDPAGTIPLEFRRFTQGTYSPSVV